MSRPYFPSKQAAVTVGVLALGLAWFSLSDAYDRRGGTTPLILRPFTWW